MSITISQSAEHFEHAVALNSQIEMINIVLKSATVNCALDYTEAFASESVSVAVSFTPADFRSVSDRFEVDVDFKLIVFRPRQDEADEVLIQVEATFTAKYAKDEAFDPPEEQANAFRESNAVFNCWPYFREFAQSTIVRMNFPAPPIPFLRMNVKPVDD